MEITWSHDIRHSAITRLGGHMIFGKVIEEAELKFGWSASVYPEEISPIIGEAPSLIAALSASEAAIRQLARELEAQQENAA